MVRGHEWDGSRRLGRVPASRRPWWAAHPVPASPLRLDWESGAPHAVLALHGDLDARTAPQLEGSVTESPPAGCVILELDLAGVRSLGSAGLSALLGLRRWCDQRGIALRVRGALPSVWRVFQLAGLDQSLAAPERPAGESGPPAQDLALF